MHNSLLVMTIFKNIVIEHAGNKGYFHLQLISSFSPTKALTYSGTRSAVAQVIIGHQTIRSVTIQALQCNNILHYNMYWYTRPNASRFTWNICTGILEKDESKHILVSDQIDGNTLDSTSGSCSSRYSIHWSSMLCAVLLITGVSAFMLLTMSFWHHTMFRYISIYASYHDCCIEIQIVLWGTCIIHYTPTSHHPNQCSYDILQKKIWQNLKNFFQGRISGTSLQYLIMNEASKLKLTVKRYWWVSARKT